MALDREDKADVKRAMGSKMANKVAKVTRDYHSANSKYKKTGTGFGSVLSKQADLERTEFASKAHEKKREMAKKIKPGFQQDGGWIGKNMVNESHAKFHYGK